MESQFSYTKYQAAATEINNKELMVHSSDVHFELAILEMRPNLWQKTL